MAALAHLPGPVAVPAFDPSQLKPGIVHLGIGAFHRAHQAVFTEDAINTKGGNWGIVGASLQRADVPDALAAQNCLYTVESLGTAARYRVMGVERAALFGDTDAFRKRLLPGRRRRAGFRPS
jgi:fructuronate reductase